MTHELHPSLDIKTIEILEKSGFLRPSLEPYLIYHETYNKQLEKSGGKIEDALVATSEICGADYSTIRRAVNKVSFMFKTAKT
tara:strand:- start:5388 stop:5636 length:249 start_codon:yes stop_codon:yes gene_type:complete